MPERKIIGTAYRTTFRNDHRRIAIMMEIDGRQVESRAAKRDDLRKRLKGYGFSPEEIAAAVPKAN